MKNKRVILNEFGSKDQLELRMDPMPIPKEGEALIQIEAASLTSTDLTIRKGLYPLLKTSPPFCLGYDFVGRILQVDEHTDGLKIGDRVAGICQIGGHSEYICFATKDLLRIDSSLNSADISPLVLSGMTAYQIFKYCARVKSGDTFLIHGGSGAVGNFLLQLCRANGIKSVSTGSASKLDFMRENGSVALDYNAANYPVKLKQVAKGGFDAAFDFTNQKSINRSFRLLKKEGRMILTGLLSTQKKMEKKTFGNFLKFGLEFGWMMMKKAFWNVSTSKEVYFFGIVDSKQDFPERYQNDFNELIQLVETKQLKIFKKEYSLDEASQAHTDLEDGKSIGNLIFSIK